MSMICFSATYDDLKSAMLNYARGKDIETYVEEVICVNELVDAAVNHGGDIGGAYYSDLEEVQRALENWINVRGLSSKFALMNDEEEHPVLKIIVPIDWAQKYASLNKAVEDNLK